MVRTLNLISNRPLIVHRRGTMRGVFWKEEPGQAGRLLLPGGKVRIIIVSQGRVIIIKSRAGISWSVSRRRGIEHMLTNITSCLQINQYTPPLITL